MYVCSHQTVTLGKLKADIYISARGEGGTYTSKTDEHELEARVPRHM